MKIDYAGYISSKSYQVLEDKLYHYLRWDEEGDRDSVMHYMGLLDVELNKAVKPDPYTYNRYAWDIYENMDDSLVLERALKWSVKSVELEPVWTFVDTKAALLYKLGRYEEAEVEAVNAIELGAGKETKQLLEDILKKVKRGNR